MTNWDRFLMHSYNLVVGVDSVEKIAASRHAQAVQEDIAHIPVRLTLENEVLEPTT